MPTKTLISEAQYLRMTFDGPEAEYVDGEIVERATPNTLHGEVQLEFGVLIHPWRKRDQPLYAFSELRIRTTPDRFRVVDLAVYRDRKPVELIPKATPFITVEIVSPDDAHEELMIKLHEYRKLGVSHVWTIDPGLRSLHVFDVQGSLIRVNAFEIPDYGLRFEAAQLFEQ